MHGNHPNRDNNPGNVISSELAKGHDQIGKDGKFAIFPSAADGWNAAMDLLSNTYSNSTIFATIQSWAPPEDGNDTESYKKGIESQTGIKGSTVVKTLDEAQKKSVVTAISKREGWSGVSYDNRND